MAYNVPYAPGAYNWWEGNQFRMPPLGQYARPVYAEALAPVASNDPSLAAATPGAVDPRILDHSMAGRGIGEMQGIQDGYQTPGVGLQAQAKNAGEFFGSIGRGVSMISNPVGFAMGVLSANRPATWSDLLPGKGLYDAVQGARDWLSGGGGGGMAGVDYGNVTGSGQGITGTRGDEGIGSFAGFGGSPEIGGRSADYETAIDSGYSTAPNEADRIAAETLGDTGMYARGGSVNKLMGPNPPGPDDGFAGLQRGEFVVRAKEAEKHRGLLDAINKGKVSKKKARGLLDR